MTPSRRITRGRYWYSARMTLALVPPKPKELDSARRTGRSLATWGVRSLSAQLGEGLYRLRVGGATLSRIARLEQTDTTPPTAPSSRPMADFVNDMETAFPASHNKRRPAPTPRSAPTGLAAP